MVKVYSTTSCPWCKKAKSYLASQNIDFIDANVQDDMNARDEMLNLSHQSGVPVINIDGNIVVGFDKDKIDELLNLK
ncbi:glutaredoxin-like YruB-family protein [Clostridium acetobutylicum]|uniref:Glutaredoxin n=1 Tax=Clostridium acetobutylicum (strain ATCC 824 / DSM 792 / JCM 1419 / IAM 19013 / LMG 5710 / NBRC 13948 / NRRL B-527 / VKM B-1787 / 2291 / W) TaxID=272562 RepID=Q97FG2_CLOAB|nr:MULTISPECIES: glutaredoxin domain-containing protein [Clostridium]AAK80721.1 Glutaredoxin [Clostridium acetobutylicum ATCC 824]ADZ21822.1 Glutaredoxin [Clostridium acetobutylicum EA 2018]AEI33119.1 glutaredoxin [Clostridium acetobutylicum DSM 1731]AWV78865.1 NrdH-redoxin [Clostridium acetobutylicum]KHD37087.1 glutaredoxin [Clostridium acetobutylicum]